MVREILTGRAQRRRFRMIAFRHVCAITACQASENTQNKSNNQTDWRSIFGKYSETITRGAH
jgi:hypothetical protein